MEALSPQANDNIAAVAEFDVLGADGKPVSREHWKIRYADSEETLDMIENMLREKGYLVED